MTAKTIFKYNPSLLSEEELIDNFVVRNIDLELIMCIVKDNTVSANQHVMVIGPRGSGKTTLVLRVAAEIRRDADLNERWYPLIFSEESYEVTSAGEFWLEALFHLAEQTGDEKWKRTYNELKKESDNDRLMNRALGQLIDFADRMGKRILLIVENMNMLFTDLINPDEAWKIRHTLMNESRIMLLASATNRFEHVENSSHAMFELYKTQDLFPLNDEECNTIWEMITGHKLEGEKIRPIRILTGGNTRLLTIIAKFGSGRSFQDLLGDLVSLIDDHTEYFKSHLDNLAPIERKVYLALAELWDYSTAREIAEAARLDVNKTSSLLSRLAGRGAVAVKPEKGRTKFYVTAERMYNIYYLMRRRGKPADRVKAAVKFMTAMYDHESAARMIIEEAGCLKPEQCRDHHLAYMELIKEIKESSRRESIIRDTPEQFWAMANMDGSLGDYVSDNQSVYFSANEFNDDDRRILKDAQACVINDSILLNFLAWEFYKLNGFGQWDIIEEWARRSVSLSSNNLYNLLTLACILSAQGKCDEALKLAETYISDSDFVEKTIDDTIELFVELAAAGYATEALKVLTGSPSAKHVEPLVVGLRLYAGEEVRTAVEILEVAKDVVKRIEERKEMRGRARQ